MIYGVMYVCVLQLDGVVTLETSLTDTGRVTCLSTLTVSPTRVWTAMSW